MDSRKPLQQRQAFLPQRLRKVGSRSSSIAWSSCPQKSAQVDYGEGALTLPSHQRALSASRGLFVMTPALLAPFVSGSVVWKSSSEVWARLHEEAFRYFGGCPQLLWFWTT